MDEPGAHELTELLLAWGDGDEAALARIAPLVHAELYRLAKRYMSRERPDHLLQTSAQRSVRTIDRLESSALAESRTFLCRCRADDAPHPCRLRSPSTTRRQRCRGTSDLP